MARYRKGNKYANTCFISPGTYVWMEENDDVTVGKVTSCKPNYDGGRFDLEVITAEVYGGSKYFPGKIHSWTMRDDTWQAILQECPVATGCNGTTEVRNQSKIIPMLNALMKRLLDKDTQTLVKAGFLNKDLSLTCEGEAEVLAIVLKANQKDLVAAAQEKIDEEEKAKK